MMIRRGFTGILYACLLLAVGFGVPAHWAMHHGDVGHKDRSDESLDHDHVHPHGPGHHHSHTDSPGHSESVPGSEHDHRIADHSYLTSHSKHVAAHIGGIVIQGLGTLVKDEALRPAPVALAAIPPPGPPPLSITALRGPPVC